MSREIGLREKALREQREAKYAEMEEARKAALPIMRKAEKAAKVSKGLVDRIIEAATKRGRPRKARK